MQCRYCLQFLPTLLHRRLAGSSRVGRRKLKSARGKRANQLRAPWPLLFICSSKREIFLFPSFSPNFSFPFSLHHQKKHLTYHQTNICFLCLVFCSPKIHSTASAVVARTPRRCRNLSRTSPTERRRGGPARLQKSSLKL